MLYEVITLHYRAMRSDPQAASYRPDTPIDAIAPWLGDQVDPADFPKHVLRFRNDRWAERIGLAELDDDAWIFV